MTNKTVVIFGVFDDLHDGHIFFIKKAKKEGSHLVAVVARDKIVKEMKGEGPHLNEAKRMNELLNVPDINRVLLGDYKNGTYNTLKEIKPDVIYLGYDQQILHEDIKEAIKKRILPEVEIICGKPFKPDVFHSSILKKKLKNNKIKA